MAAEAAKKPAPPARRGATNTTNLPAALPTGNTTVTSPGANRVVATAGTGRAVAVTLVVVALLLGSVWSVLYLNLFQARAVVIGWLSTDQSPYQAEIDFLAAKQAEMDQREGVLMDAQWNQDTFQAGLDKRELRLMQWEDELTQFAAELADNETKLNEGVTDLKTLAGIYEKMDAAKAAKVIMAIEDNGYVVRLFTNMKSASVSAIMAQLDPIRASQLTQEMLLAIPAE